MQTPTGWGRLGGSLLIAAAVTVLGVAPVAAETLPGRGTGADVSPVDHASLSSRIGQADALQQSAPSGDPVAPVFLDFYNRSGGVPVFGYPLGRPVLEEGRVAQYFERQRLEQHTENAGTPYAVELGRLGASEAEARGLLGTAPFQPLPADTASDAQCTFYAETGHRLCNGFRAYWHSHGLDFRDRGVSDRESLALFGYPISEEFQEDGVTVQYFERARMEYHPENAGTPYDILLGLLGEPAWANVAPNAQFAAVENTLGQSIADIARQYVGYPYVWGGTTPAGFDCSGFVSYVVGRALGHPFTRDMAAQASSGQPVDPRDLQPGDLVFQQNTYKAGLSHAGIYLGDGKFISAENPSTGVAIANLWDSYWGPRFYTARRITG